MIYDISSVRVVDADTIECDVFLAAFSLKWRGKIRLLGVYAPELRSNDIEEKRMGESMSNSLAHYFYTNRNEPMVVLTEKMDAFGRLLGDVIVDGKSVNDMVNDWIKARREKNTDRR